jgi:hypothetical protein
VLRVWLVILTPFPLCYKDMDPVTAVVGASAALAAGAYLNAKLSVGIDVRNLQHDRAWGKRLGAFIEALGDTVTLYHMFARVKPEVEALWFEGNTWTYGELKKGEPPEFRFEKRNINGVQMSIDWLLFWKPKGLRKGTVLRCLQRTRQRCISPSWRCRS